MDKVMMVWDWVQGPQGLILLAVLLSISEALALIPGVESNSIFQLVIKGLKFVKEKLSPKKAQ